MININYPKGSLKTYTDHCIALQLDNPKYQPNNENHITHELGNTKRLKKSKVILFRR